MAVNLGEVIRLLEKLINLEEAIEEAIENEKDKKRRKKILAAVERRDLDALRDLLFG